MITDDDAPQIVRIGEALWGERWQSEMARALDVNVNTVQKWRQGKAQPRPGVFAALREEIGRRQALLSEISAMMDDAAGKDGHGRA